MTSAGVSEKLGCANLPLSPRQRDLCRKKPFLLPSIQDGAQLAVSECQSQFRHERWNCSTSEQPPVFGHELTSGEDVETHLNPWLIMLAHINVRNSPVLTSNCTYSILPHPVKIKNKKV